MTPRLLETVLREAAARAADCGGGSLPDGELLTRYAVDRDDSAFTALVGRHGRVVWSVCRQSLPNECDAEDAFQATFLALARSATTVRASLPGWLHGTAVKICALARRTAGRRKARESNAAVREADRPVADSAWDGLLAEVHSEVTRLPANLRDAFVLVDPKVSVRRTRRNHSAGKPAR
jgi:DNA-directed RNA polymerase specialized sigma24 family protein